MVRRAFSPLIFTLKSNPSLLLSEGVYTPSTETPFLSSALRGDPILRAAHSSFWVSAEATMRDPHIRQAGKAASAAAKMATFILFIFNQLRNVFSFLVSFRAIY